MDENFMRELKNAVSALEEFNLPNVSAGVANEKALRGAGDKVKVAKALAELIKEQITNENTLPSASKAR